MKRTKDPVAAWRKTIGKHYNQQQAIATHIKIKRSKHLITPYIDPLAAFQLKWQHWSKAEKIAFITLVLILAGVSLVAIHYLVKGYIATLDHAAKSPSRDLIIARKINYRNARSARSGSASLAYDYDPTRVKINFDASYSHSNNRHGQQTTEQCVNPEHSGTNLFLSSLSKTNQQQASRDCDAIIRSHTSCAAVYPSNADFDHYAFQETIFEFNSTLPKPVLTMSASKYSSKEGESFVGLASPLFNPENMTQPLYQRAQLLLSIRAQIMQKALPQSIENLIAQVPITYDISQFESDCVLENELDEYASRIRSQLAYAFNEELLTIAMTDSATKIEVVPRIHFLNDKDAANGAYEFISHKIMIKYQAGSTDDAIRIILSNELSHFMTHYTNRLLCQNNNPSIAAVLNSECQYDTQFHEAAAMALADGLLRIRAYIDLIVQYRGGVQLSAMNKQFLGRFLDACQSFQSYEYTDIVNFSMEVLRTKYLRQTSDGQLFIYVDNHSIQLKYKYYLTDIDIVDGKLIIKGRHTPNNPTRLERAWAFLCYHERKMEAVHTGEYGTPSGAQPDPEILIGEAYSVFDMYPESLKKLLFPEVCYYLSHYHAIEDYCHRRAAP